MPRLLEVALEALAHMDEGLVAVRDELVVVVAIRDGRAARAEGTEGDLERLARAAWLRAGQARAWPVLGLPPATVGSVDRGGSIREAVATTWGTRTYETREVVENRNMSGSGCVRLEDGRVIAAAPLLRALAPVYGVELALGEAPPEASAAVTLVDDHADTHSFDAEGTRRQRTLIVDRGRFVQGVRDGADSTGHATRPLTLAPSADHLRLVPTTDDVGPVTDSGPPRSTEARALLARIEAVA